MQLPSLFPTVAVSAAPLFFRAVQTWASAWARSYRWQHGNALGNQESQNRGWCHDTKDLIKLEVPIPIYNYIYLTSKHHLTHHFWCHTLEAPRIKQHVMPSPPAAANSSSRRGLENEKNHQSWKELTIRQSSHIHMHICHICLTSIHICTIYVPYIKIYMPHLYNI